MRKLRLPLVLLLAAALVTGDIANVVYKLRRF